MLARTPWRLMTAPRSLYGLARSLARPVARGWLSLGEADSALITTTLAEERSGALEGRKASDTVAFKRWLLRQELANQEAVRARATGGIRRIIRPMLETRQPPNAVLAEAHGHNGQSGFPLTEAEVSDIVRAERYWTQQRERRHG